MNTQIKLSKEAVEEFRRVVGAAIRAIDEMEYDFMLPWLKSHLSGRKPTALRLKRRNIVRMFNPKSQEVWYEREGKVITPSFIRELKDESDINREESTDSNT